MTTVKNWMMLGSRFGWCLDVTFVHRAMSSNVVFSFSDFRWGFQCRSFYARLPITTMPALWNCVHRVGLDGHHHYLAFRIVIGLNNEWKKTWKKCVKNMRKTEVTIHQTICGDLRHRPIGLSLCPCDLEDATRSAVSVHYQKTCSKASELVMAQFLFPDFRLVWKLMEVDGSWWKCSTYCFCEILFACDCYILLHIAGD